MRSLETAKEMLQEAQQSNYALRAFKTKLAREQQSRQHAEKELAKCEAKLLAAVSNDEEMNQEVRALRKQLNHATSRKQALHAMHSDKVGQHCEREGQLLAQLKQAQAETAEALAAGAAHELRATQLEKQTQELTEVRASLAAMRVERDHEAARANTAEKRLEQAERKVVEHSKAVEEHRVGAAAAEKRLELLQKEAKRKDSSLEELEGGEEGAQVCFFLIEFEYNSMDELPLSPLW